MTRNARAAGIEALLFDVGGVFLVPAADVVGPLLTNAGIWFDPGAGVPVLASTDSFHVGVAKPQAEVFASAVEALGAPPE